MQTTPPPAWFHGSAHGYRETAKALRGFADQLEQHAATMEAKATEPGASGARLAHRAMGALRSALAAWRAG